MICFPNWWIFVSWWNLYLGGNPQQSHHGTPQHNIYQVHQGITQMFLKIAYLCNLYNPHGHIICITLNGYFPGSLYMQPGACAKRVDTLCSLFWMGTSYQWFLMHNSNLTEASLHHNPASSPMWSQQLLAHAMTALPSWHVINFVVIQYLRIG